MQAPVVRVETQGSVLVVTLDRPGKRNAVSAAVTRGLNAAFNHFDDDDSLRVAVLAARGPVFCAGSDLVEGPGEPTARGGKYGFIRRHRVKPVVAAVDGPAIGGGFELVLACDLVVASSAASFSLPEAARGRLPDAGGLFRTFDRLPRNVGHELLLAGRSLGASRAYELGFVTTLSAPGSALDDALALAHEVCGSAPSSVEQALTAVRDLDGPAEAEGWRATAAAVASLDPAQRAEGLAAFREHRTPAWPHT